MSRTRIAALFAALVVVVASGVAIAILNGVRIAYPAAASYQYGEPEPDIWIVKASAARTGVVTLRVKITDWIMYPRLVGKRPNKTDGGHWAIFVDGRFNAASANSTTGKTRPLTKGIHKIYSQLANNDGSYLFPHVKSQTVRVRVKHTVKKAKHPRL